MHFLGIIVQLSIVSTKPILAHDECKVH